MKVLSDIYTYSKDKSTVVFGSNTTTESKKEKEKKIEEKSSWFSRNWKSSTTTATTTTVSTTTNKGWLNKVSLPKFTYPKLSLPKFTYPKFKLPELNYPKYTLPELSLPSLPSLTLPSLPSFPKFPKFTIPRFNYPTFRIPEWIKPNAIYEFILRRFEELKFTLVSYSVEVKKFIKRTTTFILDHSYSCLNCSILNCTTLQFNSNSNSKYASNPWYQRLYFTARDNLNEYVNIKKEKMSHSNSQISNSSDNTNSSNNDNNERITFEETESKIRLEEQRNNSNNNNNSGNDEKYEMKHSQSSKYSNYINNIRTIKKLKKTNTQDLKNGEEPSSFSIKNTNVFSMFSKTDIDNKNVNDSNVVIEKSDSLYVDAHEDKIEQLEENKNTEQVKNEESINESNDTNNTESSKFNIKRTWDKFSKIIS